MRKLRSKHVAGEIAVEMWVDLGLVGNESDQPTEHGSALRICYKKAITPDCSTQQVPSGYILLALLVHKVSKRDYTTLPTCCQAKWRCLDRCVCPPQQRLCAVGVLQF